MGEDNTLKWLERTDEIAEEEVQLNWDKVWQSFLSQRRSILLGFVLVLFGFILFIGSEFISAYTHYAAKVDARLND